MNPEGDPTAATGAATLQLFQYALPDGWSCPRFPDLDSAATLVLVFGAKVFGAQAAPIRQLTAAYPRSCMLGCSTAGEILGDRLSDDSIAVAVVRLQRTRLQRATAAVSPSTSFAAGQRIAAALRAPDLRGVFLLSDGILVNGSELVRGLNAVLPAGVVVTGGLAGDGHAFGSTWVLDGGLPASGIVSAVGFYGDAVRIGHGSRGGWDTFGPERLITKSRDNVLFELDGKPALQLYKDYLGERCRGLPATALLFPLALRAQGAEDKRVVRTVLAVDEAAQSLTFAGDVPQGHHARLMRANFDRLVDGAAQAARQAGATGAEHPLLTIAISCVGRRLVLGERTEEEIEALLEGATTPQLGFYSYGEVSPYTDGFCDLHNQTMTVTTIAEA